MRKYLYICVFCGMFGCSGFASDEVGLPSPVPESIFPNSHISGTSVPVTIRGRYFIVKLVRHLTNKMELHVDDQFNVELHPQDSPSAKKIALDGIRYVDFKTLTATIPSLIPKGKYNLVITTPYGLTGNLDNAFTSFPNDIDTDSGTDMDTDKDAGTDSGGEVDCEGTSVWRDTDRNLCWQNPHDELFYYWDDADGYCDTLVLDGYDDWKMPNTDDLRSLIRGCPNTQTGGDCLVVDGSDDSDMDEACNGCEPLSGPGDNGCYWSKELKGACDVQFWSSSLPPDSGVSKWHISFKDGAIENSYGVTKYVRCVRSGQ